MRRLTLIVFFACGALWTQSASAINPTVLAPSAGTALPQGTMKTNPRPNGTESVRPHAPEPWHNAIPAHRKHRHCPPFMRDGNG